MNVKLSVYSNRVKNKSGFAIYVNGVVVDSLIGKTTSSNIKEDIITQLTKGLRACRNVVSHEDIMYIEIQNQHLCAWLNGNQEFKGNNDYYKNYSNFLDKAFDVLESLDCRYRFMFVPKPACKSLVDEGKVEVKGSSIENAFSDLV